MNRRILLFFSICFSGILVGMHNLDKTQPCYQYRLAKQADVPALLDLINTQAIRDNTKIVILPKVFREGALRSAIEKKRIFIALDQDRIIGYKKLFIMMCDHEKSDILNDEIRCINNEQNCVFAGYIDNDTIFVPCVPRLAHNCYSICIYNGGDFTLPSYRGKGINQQLTKMALLSLVADVKDYMHNQGVNTITMVYGVTQANAGIYPGAPSDRTVSISKAFKVFIHMVEGYFKPITLQHQRYRAFMPTFDPDSQVLQPLSDDQSIPGFGCVLTYIVRREHE